MGEVPIFTTKAHVFLIDPHTRKSWMPASKTAIPVNFFFDSSRQTYRIISVEGSKAVINSTVTPNMTFTKTSAKFGQWADVRANTVYGLGFATDKLLNKFLEQFEDIRERAKQLQEQGEQSQAPVATVIPNPPSQINGTRNIVNEDKPNLPRVKKEEALVQQKEADEEMSLSSASDDSRSTNQSMQSELKHLRCHNDRLKLALAQSSANAKKWETELQALKNTNARLTTALQESMSNVDQWHRQLATYKEENERGKRRIQELESEVNKGQELSEQNLDLRRQIEVERKQKKEKEQECNLLQQRVDVLNVVEDAHADLSNRLKQTQADNEQLKQTLMSYEIEIENYKKDRSKRQLSAQQVLGQLADKLTDITELTQNLQVAL